MLGLKIAPIALTVNKFGCYIGPKDAKCWFCEPEPSKLDRVFIVTSNSNLGEHNVALHKKVQS